MLLFGNLFYSAGSRFTHRGRYSTLRKSDFTLRESGGTPTTLAAPLLKGAAPSTWDAAPPVAGEPIPPRKAARSFLAEHPKLSGLKVAEGSGISYENSANASSLIALLELFEPHRGLLRLHEGTPHKTGTLRVSKTVIGYHDSAERGRLKFVIALDRNGYYRKWKVLKAIKKHF